MTQATSISRASVPQTSVSDTLKNAVTAAVLTAILTIPVLGLQLKLDGYKVVLEPHWRPVWIAVGLVFLFQLCKPFLLRARSAVKLPAVPAMGAKQQRSAVWVLLAVGLVFPFFGSRGAVDVATLALIYVILGLGLTSWWAMPACSTWATWASMRWAAIPTRC